MSVIQFPDSLRVASFRWGFKEQQIVHRGPFGAQALATGSPVLEVEMSGVPQYWTEAQEAESFLESLKGFENHLALHNMTRPVPLGTMRGAMTLVAAAAQGATTLQIKSADLGAELVTNGAFAVDTSGWTAYPSADTTLSVVAGAMRIEAAVGGAAYPSAYQSFTTVAGKVYEVTAAFSKAVPNGGILVKNGTVTGTVLVDHDITASGTVRFSFTATGSTTVIQPIVKSAVDGEYGDFDNISVKENKAAGKTLLKNDWLGIGSGLTQQVVKVAADATADINGVISVTTTTPLRNAFAAGAAVTWDKPKALFRQKSLNEGIEYQAVIGQPWALSLREDWR